MNYLWIPRFKGLIHLFHFDLVCGILNVLTVEEFIVHSAVFYILETAEIMFDFKPW